MRRKNPQITAEENVPGQGRIDLAIKGDSPQPRIVGIEVKTTDASVTPGQLERYRNGLAEKFPQHAIAIAYLTPFNRERAKGKADDLATVREFDDFRRKCPDGPPYKLAGHRRHPRQWQPTLAAAPAICPAADFIAQETAAVCGAGPGAGQRGSRGGFMGRFV